MTDNTDKNTPTPTEKNDLATGKVKALTNNIENKNTHIL